MQAWSGNIFQLRKMEGRLVVMINVKRLIVQVVQQHA